VDGLIDERAIMGKITSIQVAAMRPADKPTRVEIDTGLQLRIATDGVKTWTVRYRVNGKQRDYRLPKDYGIVTDEGHMSLADARSEAARIRALARNGVDIRVQIQEEEQRRQHAIAAAAEKRALEHRDNLTVRDMYDAWMADGVRRLNDNAVLRRSFTIDVLPKIGALPIRTLTEHELRAVLRAIVARGADRTAIMTRDNLKQMFSWAGKRSPWRKLLIEGDPMELIEIEKIVSPGYDMNNQRDRILTPDEIRQLHGIFLRMEADYDCSPDKRYAAQPVEAITQRAIWIMMSTMCRVGETCMARWADIDLNSARWHIPRENVKDRLANLDVFLSPFALHQFRQLHQITGGTEWCFPARNHDGHLDGKSITKQVGDRQSQFKKSRDGAPRRPLKNRRHDNSLVLGGGAKGAWTPHDLRRTGATMMQALGVPLDIIDRCQNHVLQGSRVRRHYLHHDYAAEKRDAWRELGDRLSLILNPLAPGQ
jgi:integrase